MVDEPLLKLTPGQVKTLRRARGPIQVGRKLYMVCAACESWVRINKPIIGGWHFCPSDNWWEVH